MKAFFSLRLATLTMVFIFFAGCVERDNVPSGTVYLYSNDRSKAITVFTNGTSRIRFIADGIHKTLPKSQYYKLDISNVHELGNSVGVCWNTDGYEWDFVNDDARIIEAKMDTTRFRLKTSLPKDDLGIPTPAFYVKEGCFRVDMLYGNVIPAGHSILEKKPKFY